MATNIEWTDATWNPSTGCTKVSPGCAHCYAETLTKRYAGSPGWPETFLPWVPGNDTVVLHPDRLDAPLHWRTPRRVFVDSMSDLFHDDVPFEFIDRVFAVMALTPQHTYQVLTKRPARMREYLTAWEAGEAQALKRVAALVWAMRHRPPIGVTYRDVPSGTPWPLPNFHAGVTVENQRWADERIPILLDTPAAVRFISAEPLLGPVDLGLNRWVRIANTIRSSSLASARLLVEPGVYRADSNPFGALSINRLGIMPGEFERLPNPDWVICGGESGPKHRRLDAEWALNLRLQCQGSTAFFMKQLGGARPGNKLEDLPEDLRVREYPR